MNSTQEIVIKEEYIEIDYFDIRNVSEEEIRQFKNLKKMEVMPQENWDEMEVFKKCGIEVEEI